MSEKGVDAPAQISLPVPHHSIGIPKTAFDTLLLSEEGVVLAAVRSEQEAKAWLELVKVFRQQGEALQKVVGLLSIAGLSDSERCMRLRLFLGLTVPLEKEEAEV